MNTDVSLALAQCADKLMNPHRKTSTKLTLVSWLLLFVIGCHCAMIWYQGVVSMIFGDRWLGFAVHSLVVIPVGIFGIALPVSEFKLAQRRRL